MVTLVPAPGNTCLGMAYLVEHDVFDHLDHREKNGYQRFRTRIALRDQATTVSGVVYVADEDNHAFLGPAPLPALAAHIDAARGPSGSNRDYVLHLAQALQTLGDEDPHVHALAALLSAPD